MYAEARFGPARHLELETFLYIKSMYHDLSKNDLVWPARLMKLVWCHGLVVRIVASHARHSRFESTSSQLAKILLVLPSL